MQRIYDHTPRHRIPIALRYPAPWAHKSPDPRGDPRIKAALVSMGKLR